MKLLLADDEVVTRRGIKNNINWENLGIEEIREVEDGQEGVELLEKYAPDILLTDIRMPFLNGIDLAIKTKEKYPDCKIIFLSAFSDKEYLKAAINIGAVNYIEKPIDLNELEETIKKTVDMKKSENNYLEPKELKRVLAEKLIRKNDEYQIPRKVFDKLNLLFNEISCFNVIIIKKSSIIGKKNDILEITNKYLREYFGAKHIIGIEKNEQNIIWIIEHDNSEFSEIIKKIKRIISSKYPEDSKQLFYAVGEKVVGMEKIYKSYQFAVLNLQMLFWKGYGNIIFSYPDAFDEKSTSFDELLVNFENKLDSETEAEISNWVDKKFMSFKLYKNIMSNDIKNLVFQMTLKLYQSEHMDMNFNKKAKEPYLWEQIFKIETLDKLNEYFSKKLSIYFRNKEKKRKYSQTVRKVMEIIDEEYMQLDLSTKDLAKRVYLTTSYLSGLFKEEKGQTISKYIQKVRIEKSKKLLLESKFTLLEIAVKVGYRDANYYAKIFKKIYGCPPSEYRERL